MACAHCVSFSFLSIRDDESVRSATPVKHAATKSAPNSKTKAAWEEKPVDQSAQTKEQAERDTHKVKDRAEVIEKALRESTQTTGKETAERRDANEKELSHRGVVKERVEAIDRAVREAGKERVGRLENGESATTPVQHTVSKEIQTGENIPKRVNKIASKSQSTGDTAKNRAVQTSARTPVKAAHSTNSAPLLAARGVDRY